MVIARALIAALLGLWAEAAHAAVSVTLYCALPGNDDGRTSNVFALDPDAKTVRDYYVDFNGDVYMYGPDFTYPALFSGPDVTWREKADTGSTTFMLQSGSGKWSATVSYPDGSDPERADCTVWQKPAPGGETQ